MVLDQSKTIPQIPQQETTQPSLVQIINLSNKILNTAETKLLLNGLKFTPTPKRNIPELQKDVDSFSRTLRLVDYYSKSDQNSELIQNTSEPTTLVKLKGKFNPPKNNTTLENNINCLQNYLSDLQPLPKCKSNLNASEYKALQNLTQDHTIIIKEADKGGAVVIMNANYYEEKIMEILKDDKTYEPISNYNENTVMNKISKLAKKHNCLNKKELEYLTKFNYKTSNFYGLPKVHKSQNINNAIQSQGGPIVNITSPGDLKFRPIVAGPISDTSHLSSLLDEILKPYVNHVPSNLKDTYDFLKKLPESPNPDTFPITYDVKDLYTSIDHELGLTAVRYWLQKHPNSREDRFTDIFILEGLSIVLKENFFGFDGQIFLQKNGTAMGTKVAPTYATLVLGYLEEKIYDILNLSNPTVAQYFQHNWMRFLDDCFLLYHPILGTLGDLDKLLNSLHPMLQFIRQDNTNNVVNFLDCSIYKNTDTGKFDIDIYSKPTDTHQYLNFKSCHPKHIKYNLPYSLALRIQTIVTNSDTKELRFYELKQNLIARGYPINIIEKGIKKAQTQHREVQLNKLKSKPPTNTGESIFFVQTYNPNNPVLTTKVHNLIDNLQNQKPVSSFKNKKVIKCFKQAPNLKKTLCKAAFNKNKKVGIFKCKKPRCTLCNNIQET